MQNSSISSFKRFLLKFILPAIIAVGVFAVGFDYIFDRKIILQTESSGAYKVYKNININEQSEIPIFGSSRASGSYIPDIIDPHCFNYGIEKTQCDLLEIFLKNELAKKKATPIIINFDYELWSDWVGDLANYIPNLADKDIQYYFRRNDKWYYHVPGLRYYGLYQHYFKSYEANKSNKNYLNKGGFFLLEKTSATDLADEIEMRKKNPSAYIPDPVHEARFIKLISSDPARKVIVIVAPYHSSYLKTLIGRTLASQFLERLKTIHNVSVFDYSDAPYPDSLFKNTTHLNYLGAQRFSNEIKTQLHTVAPDYFK